MDVSYVKIFNQVVDEFFRELIELFPGESKIKVNYTLFQTICKANSKKPCSDFMIGSIPYLEKIAIKDEQFFISADKPKLLSSMNIEKLWPDMTPKTKNAIWKYIVTFFTIGNKVVQMPPETMGLINFIINNNN
uniref:Uncharacterized protein n=1 Tax=viral metagenome TaxID=1070528 RepID=A0A6C0I9V7_9ZZZZ